LALVRAKPKAKTQARGRFERFHLCLHLVE
jgi:rRNA pseudouridine-1189 N-methylase Emg1 (Nep1/Mra1 family)